ncbi:alpha/beta hydrolase [Streptomyces sp. NRRL F-2664]|uniref:alpha/beta hydrolase n=1 Tax=Streptomyces sp. NRRL F-2664 TaxID=1463842 RepID=UPI0004CB9942|nr:alpha/beta hydrolase [Streptomyces sp. NRRL F-2664]
MDYATLKALKPSEFTEAADGYRAVSSMADHAYASAESQIPTRLRAGLRGEAVDEAVVQLGLLAQNFHYTQVECGLAATALNALAASLTTAKSKLDAALSDAEAAKFSVGPDGSVSYPPAGQEKDGKLPDGGTVSGSAKGKPSGNVIDPTKDANDLSSALERQAANIHPNPNFGKAVDIANRIAQAVADATEADTQWAPKLRKLKADDDLVVTDKDWADVQADTGEVRSGAADYLSHIKPPPAGGDPKANAEWWKGLSADEQAAYLSLNAAQVGALDGLPSVTRDEANRTVLAERKAEFQIRLDAIPPQPQKYIPSGRDYPAVVLNPEWSRWDKKYSDEKAMLEKNLDGMNAIQARFDSTGKEGLPEAYLLGFDTKDGGRAIVANGNPDTAAHTAVFVPGTYTSIVKTEDYIHHMSELWKETNAQAEGRQVSTITWIGYDAPQSIVPEAMKKHYAEDAAPDLNRFMAGLENLQGGDDKSHTTIIGHSYGSTVLGAASNAGDLRADDMIAVGSPGMLVGHARELDAGEGHVWSQSAGALDDQVPAGGKFAGLGGGNKWWKEMLPFGSVWGQNVPSDEDFGANIMANDSNSHTDYWRDHSLSIRNQASVVAGRYDDVQRG